MNSHRFKVIALNAKQPDNSLGKKAASAAKWSLVTQIVSKLISPITQVALAHLLAPEIFGAIALINMIVAFCDIFSDAGFQKYIIQHEYKSKDDIELSANVAFWTNLAVSLALWILAIIFRVEIAGFVGDASVALGLAVACGALPLTSIVSVQTALFQRDLNFKALFRAKIGSSLFVLVVSLPLALFGFGYWSIIFGNLASNLALAVYLSLKSTWRPQLKYSAKELKEMFSFSFWTLVESYSIWLTSWAGTIILGNTMEPYYLGLYNTSVSLVNAFINIAAGAVNPVAFSSMSRLQNNASKFRVVFFQIQSYLALAVVPAAFFLFVFRNSIVSICLGEVWLEAALFFGLYSLAGAFVVIFGHSASNAYRAAGKPYLSLMSQICYLVVFIPSLMLGANIDFYWFSIIVPAARFLGTILVDMIICKVSLHLSPLRMMRNLLPIYALAFSISAPIVAVVCFANPPSLLQIPLMILFIISYMGGVLILKKPRGYLLEILRYLGADKTIPGIATFIAQFGTANHRSSV